VRGSSGRGRVCEGVKGRSGFTGNQFRRDRMGERVNLRRVEDQNFGRWEDVVFILSETELSL